MFFSAKGGMAIDDSSGFTNRFRFGKTSFVAQDGASGDLSSSPKISSGISSFVEFKKSSNFNDLQKISSISSISSGCRGYFWMRRVLAGLTLIRKR